MRADVKYRACVQCGYEFWGTNKFCSKCQMRDRICDSCGTQFRGLTKLCWECRKIERVCACGRAYFGNHTKCPACSKPYKYENACITCGVIYVENSRTQKCKACRKTERVCVECGYTFRGNVRKCWSCASSIRECDNCGESNLMGQGARICQKCYRANNPEKFAAYDSAHQNSRRALKYSATITGPISARVYRAIIASGPCVYCGDAAKTVDHIQPLARGGIEHESNLVPACVACNTSKHARLLTEWDTAKVRRAVSVSPLVAAEYARLTA